MRITKIAAATACGLTLLLLTLTFTVKNPEVALYEQTVETLMEQEDLASSQEVEERFPMLIGVRAKMNRIADLKRFVLDKTQSPAPIITEEEVLQLEYYKQKIHQLRRGVKVDLSQLLEVYAESQP